MDLQLQNRTALVTGASAGIGASIARLLAEEGVKVAAVARRRDKLEQLAASLANTPHRLTLIDADVTTQAAEIAARATEALGPIDILMNAAGGSRPTSPEAGDDVWDEAFALNFTHLRRLTTALLPAMQARRWGRIINISGTNEPRTLNAAAAAKGAVHLWAKGLSCDVAAQGVTINTIQPGRIHSEQIDGKLYPTERSRQDYIDRNIPIGFFGQPEDLAVLAVFLASPRAHYITGTVIPVDGGAHYFAH